MSFKQAQEALHYNRAIVLPHKDDEIWIVTDGSVKKHGVGATMYGRQHNKLRLAGYFRAKIHKQQVNWLLCEIKAPSIGLAVQHFSPYLVQSKHHSHIITNSTPCIQAFIKLC